MNHLFACDVNPASREFIARNTQPTALFADLLARGQLAHCLRAERPRLVPGNLDIYVAGFPCKDFSMLNTSRSCLQGPHAMIFHGVVQYIRDHRPSTFVLENVSGMTMSHQGAQAPIYEVMRTLRAISGYEVRGFAVNTQNFYLPQNRKRVYIVGVHTKKARLRRPLETWGQVLHKLQQPLEASAHDFLLPDSAPEVVAEMKRLGRLPARKLPADRQRWMATHRTVRRKLGLPPKPTIGSRGWCPLLSERMLEVVDVAAARAAKAAGRPACQTDFVAEVSRGLLFASTMARISPCVTPSGRLWFFNRWRWMIGTEMMALQGFPVDSLDLSVLAQSEIAMLAGNAMSVPVVGAFLLLVLAFVEFPERPQ